MDSRDSKTRSSLNTSPTRTVPSERLPVVKVTDDGVQVNCETSVVFDIFTLSYLKKILLLLLSQLGLLYLNRFPVQGFLALKMITRNLTLDADCQ